MIYSARSKFKIHVLLQNFPVFHCEILGFPQRDVEDSLSSCMYRVTGVNRSRRFDGGTYCLCLEGLKGPTLQGEGTTLVETSGSINPTTQRNVP